MNAPPGSASTASGPVVVDKTYDLVLWLIQKVEKFPKSYRFSVGQRLIDTGLDLLLLLVDAAYRKDKRDTLRAAGLRTNAEASSYSSTTGGRDDESDFEFHPFPSVRLFASPQLISFRSFRSVPLCALIRTA